MEQEKKEKIQEAAQKVAVGAFGKAKLLSGWKKWAAIVIGTLAAAAGAWLMTGCSSSFSQNPDGMSWVIEIVPFHK